jgi:hypothetical protein
MKGTKMGGSMGAGWYQVIEKRETENKTLGPVIEVLIKGNIGGKDFVRYDKSTAYGLCEGYIMIEAVSNNLLEVSEYHYCQKDFEDYEEGREDHGGSWARVEIEGADRTMMINSFAEFKKIYTDLYECIASQNGWGKTVKCSFQL